jgi:UDP-D-galactose:(glucosyl)LPS alpha-1,6-D-galactosyltransferase
MASVFEGFPLGLIEALARGIPVIATNCPTGPSDIVYDGLNGLLIPPGSVDAFRGALERALHPDPWSWNAQQIQNNAVNRFNASRVFAAMLAGINAVSSL